MNDKGYFSSSSWLDLVRFSGLKERPSTRQTKRHRIESCYFIYCLNYPTPPPGIPKAGRRSAIESWIDPAGSKKDLMRSRIRTSVTTHLREFFGPEIAVMISFDPDLGTIERRIKQLHKTGPALVYYNGHGVPVPTSLGEVYIFNLKKTEYVPCDVQSVFGRAGRDSVYIFDSDKAGILYHSFPSDFEGIALFSCGKDEFLPASPDLPVDLFTSCLFSPLRTAVVFHFTSRYSSKILLSAFQDEYKKTHGLGGRREPFGNFKKLVNNKYGSHIAMYDTFKDRDLARIEDVYKCIVDCIAWETFGVSAFQKLFRNDPATSNLLRNFLLAERVMSFFKCNPMSIPRLRSVSSHNMWNTWDWVLDAFINYSQGTQVFTDSSIKFFEYELNALSAALMEGSDPQPVMKKLPILYYTLGIKEHSDASLEILVRFLKYGDDAVQRVIQIGIPSDTLATYVPRTKKQTEMVVEAWGYILSHDKSLSDILQRKDSTLNYQTVFDLYMDADSSTKLRMHCAIVLISAPEPLPGDEHLAHVLEIVKDEDEDALLLEWTLFLLAVYWRDGIDRKHKAFSSGALETLMLLSDHPDPNVRAASTYSLSLLISNVQNPDLYDYDEGLEEPISDVSGFSSTDESDSSYEYEIRREAALTSFDLKSIRNSRGASPYKGLVSDSEKCKSIISNIVSKLPERLPRVPDGSVIVRNETLNLCTALVNILRLSGEMLEDGTSEEDASASDLHWDPVERYVSLLRDDLVVEISRKAEALHKNIQQRGLQSSTSDYDDDESSSDTSESEISPSPFFAEERTRSKSISDGFYMLRDTTNDLVSPADYFSLRRDLLRGRARTHKTGGLPKATDLADLLSLKLNKFVNGLKIQREMRDDGEYDVAHAAKRCANARNAFQQFPDKDFWVKISEKTYLRGPVTFKHPVNVPTGKFPPSIVKLHQHGNDVAVYEHSDKSIYRFHPSTPVGKNSPGVQFSVTNKLSMSRGGSVKDLVLVNDRKYMALMSQTPSVVVIDYDGRVTTSWTMPTPFSQDSIVFNWNESDGTLYYSSSPDTVLLWSAESEKVASTIALDKKSRLKQIVPTVSEAVLLSFGDGTLVQNDSGVTEEILSVPAGIHRFSVNPDSNRISVLDRNGSFLIYDYRNLSKPVISHDFFPKDVKNELWSNTKESMVLASVHPSLDFAVMLHNRNIVTSNWIGNRIETNILTIRSINQNGTKREIVVKTPGNTVPWVSEPSFHPTLPIWGFTSTLGIRIDHW